MMDPLAGSTRDFDLIRRPRDERLAELARDIAAAGYLKGDFVLSSGIRSQFYLDKYLFVTKPGILRRIASLLADLLPAETERIAGQELGAVPIATAVAIETGLPFVILRKTSTGRGSTTSVEGDLYPGEGVTVIEDVVTTGSQATHAARQVKNAGARVIAVMAVIDRDQGAAEALAASGYSYSPLLSRSDLGL